MTGKFSTFSGGIVGVVDATSFEQLMLWQEEEKAALPKRWETINPGILETIGALADMPVCLSLSKVRVGGHLLLFIEATSQVVDHRMIDKWLEDNLPDTAKRDGRVNRTDAMNFHNVFHEQTT